MERKNGDKAYELNITSDYADRSLLEIVGTLLHEMIHRFAIENVIQDMYRDVRDGKLKIIEDKVKSNLSSTRKYICLACRMSESCKYEV